jgi:hypothetical protein
MKTLVVLSALSIFSFSAAAQACDGMRDHDKSDTQSQAKNESGKSASKAKKDSAKQGQTESGANKS